MSAAGIFVASLTPVVYTEGAGSPGPNELLAPAGQVGTYELPVAGPRGEAVRVLGAWHTPVDNLPSLGAFTRLDVVPSPQHPGAVQLSAAGVAGQQGRIRVRITALCELGGSQRGGY